MRKKSMVTTLLAGALTAAMLAGCGNQEAGTPAADTASDTAQEQAASEEEAQEETGEEDTSQAEEPAAEETEESVDSDVLMIARQGMFSAGGTVTEPVEGEYDPTNNWLDATRAGNTAHVDHANVFYQIPVNDNGNPIVYLHGYGQSRMGWMTTPDGREGWSDLFLKKGYPAFLVD